MTTIGFALLSDSRNPIPSTRIACLNLFPHLHAAGYQPTIVFEPAFATETPDVSGLVERVLENECKIVVFQKIHGPSVLHAVNRLRAAGVRTIYCVCDLVDNEMASAVDATIAVAEFLRSLYRPELQKRIHVVHDGIERPDLYKTPEQVPTGRAARAPLTATLVTSHPIYAVPVLGVPPARWRLDIIGAFPSNRLQYRRALSTTDPVYPARTMDVLRALLHPRIRHIPWDFDDVYRRLLQSDIGIIPIDTTQDGSAHPYWKLKSENRLTLKMAAGLPVVATPIPAYEAVIRHGENGFLAQSRRDWLSCLTRVQDSDLRREMGSKARQSVLARFSIEAQAERFLNVLRLVQQQSEYSVSTFGVAH